MKRLIVPLLLGLVFVGCTGLAGSCALPSPGSSSDKDSSYSTPPSSSDTTTPTYLDYSPGRLYPP